MGFHLKQWRNQQHESEEQQHSTKMPKLLPGSHQHQQSSASALPLFVPEPNTKVSTHLSDSTLATTNRFPSKFFFPFLFCDRKKKLLIKKVWLASGIFLLFKFAHSSLFTFLSSLVLTKYVSLFPLLWGWNRLLCIIGMGSYFSLAQWQELELQALIFRYMLAGAAVPSELLQPIKKSLLHSPPYFLHHPLQHYQPATCKLLTPIFFTVCYTRFSTCYTKIK